ncbi:unnamed protein product, partial [Rotaria sp. Silwood1]
MNRQRRRQMAENYLVIWVDGNINMENEDCQNTLAQLRGVVNDVNPCTTAEQCIDKLQENSEETSFVISSGALGQHLVPEIHGMPKLDGIYIFCGNKQRHQEWAKDWPKIKGVHTTIKSICEKLAIAVKQCNQDQVTVSIIGVNEGGSSEDLNQLEPSFMYTQIFKEILLDMDHGQQAIKDLVTFCQEHYKGNKKELKIIDEFQRTYEPALAIWWYTRQCFTYKMLNRALRTLDGDIIIRMGFYLCDVHRQIEDLHSKQINKYHVDLKLTADDDQQLRRLTDRIAEEIGGSGWYRLGKLLLQIGQFDKAEELYTTLLEQASNDSDKAHLYHQLGMVKEKRGEYKEAISSYEKYLKIKRKTLPEDHPSLAATYNNIGLAYNNMGEYPKALEFYEKAHKIKEKALPPNHPDLAQSYNNIGSVYNDMGDYLKALEFYEKAHKIFEKALPPNHPDLAQSYNNIGSVYNDMGDYSKALEFYERALKIREKALPPNHPDLAQSYNNIGGVYNDMGDYSKALGYSKKDLEITKQALPPNHPDLATTYNWFGKIYRGMKDYPKALENFEKCLSIRQKALPENHPDKATTYSDIGDVHRLMGDYEKALSFHRKALNIQENVQC